MLFYVSFNKTLEDRSRRSDSD